MSGSHDAPTPPTRAEQLALTLRAGIDQGKATEHVRIKAEVQRRIDKYKSAFHKAHDREDYIVANTERDYGVAMASLLTWLDETEQKVAE